MNDAFNRDGHLLTAVRDLVAKNKIDVIIETGTYHGITTRELSLMATTHTIESNLEYFNIASDNLVGFEVTRHYGSSPDVLRELLPALEGKKVFLFLDAHWNGTPL